MRFKKPDSIRWVHFFGSMERYKDLVPFFAFTHSRIHDKLYVLSTSHDKQVKGKYIFYGINLAV
jgi:hypothetical protein